MDEQSLEDDTDVTRFPEHTLDPRTATPRSNHDQISFAHVAQPFAVEDDVDIRYEEGLAEKELAAPRHLDDEAVGKVRP